MGIMPKTKSQSNWSQFQIVSSYNQQCEEIRRGSCVYPAPDVVWNDDDERAGVRSSSKLYGNSDAVGDLYNSKPELKKHISQLQNVFSFKAQIEEIIKASFSLQLQKQNQTRMKLCWLISYFDISRIIFLLNIPIFPKMN